MTALWSLTEAQFLVLYTGFVLVAIGARVVVTGGTLVARRRDGANVFFLAVVALGLVRAIAEYIMRDAGGVVALLLTLVGMLWFMAYRDGHVIVRRKRFWLFWGLGMLAVVAVGTGLLDLGDVGDVGEGGRMVSFVVMMVLLFAMAPADRGSSGGGGCGGDGCGG